jgi:hypothetical protein
VFFRADPRPNTRDQEDDNHGTGNSRVQTPHRQTIPPDEDS